VNDFVEKIKTFFERQAFGVCEWWGEKFEIKSANIRLFFIYTSFLAIGSPLIIYLVMAFVLNLRKMVKSTRGNIWDM
jgi:phage shock protein PspC (stress-responsive transcriptional regulator)